MYLKQMEKDLSILAEIEKEKPKLYALIEMNISERSEVEIKKCTNALIEMTSTGSSPSIINTNQSRLILKLTATMLNRNKAIFKLL